MQRDIKATLFAVRAIGSRFGVAIWNQIALTAGIAAAAVIALLIWLVSVSAWWYLLAIPMGLAMSVALVILIVFRLLLNHVNTAKTTKQKQAVTTFVEKVRFVQEFTSTPKFIILFRVIRSVAAPSSEKYLESIFESKHLKRDFTAVVDSFKD